MEDKKINANPTKRFFIEMLIRDIALEPAIAELVDNSMDGIRLFRKNTGYKEECSIDVDFNKESFTIKDNCGGISIHDAKYYCFRFGRDNDREFELSNGTGVFGIGMKRALFRMGKVFDIYSRTPREHFHIHIDVDEWLADTNSDWTFAFDDIGENETNDYSVCGTEIRITKLHDPINASFSNPYFRESFFNYIRQRCSTAKSLGLIININDRTVQYIDEKILFSDKFKPYVKNINVDDMKIRIIAGCAKLGNPQNAGWYIQCNHRMVLFANQGEDTGWGTDGVPRFHGEFAPFRGYVLFESSNLEHLPWNTTKTGVDISSKYYQIALTVMKECTKLFSKWRNQVSEFLESSDGQVKAADIYTGVEKEVFSETISNYVHDDNQFQFPLLNDENYPVPEEPRTTIRIIEKKSKIENIKQYYGRPKMTNQDVGKRIFDYFYEREIEEDE